MRERRPCGCGITDTCAICWPDAKAVDLPGSFEPSTCGNGCNPAEGGHVPNAKSVTGADAKEVYPTDANVVYPAPPSPQALDDVARLYRTAQVINTWPSDSYAHHSGHPVGRLGGFVDNAFAIRAELLRKLTDQELADLDRREQTEKARRRRRKARAPRRIAALRRRGVPPSCPHDCDRGDDW